MAKILRWLLFGVIGSLLPLIINFLMTLPKSWSYSPIRVISRGELCIVVAAMCSVSAGELFGSTSKNATMAVLSGGVTILILALSTALYVSIPAVNDLPDYYVGDLSYVLFICALISSLCCIGLSVET
jgi:hypothetical protein